MKGQPVGAPGALGTFAAVDAHQRPGIAPAVEEEDGLVPMLQVIPDGIQQKPRKRRIIALFQFLFHVHDLHPGQASPAETGTELIEPVVAAFGPVHGLHTGGRGAQEHQGVFMASPPDGHLLGRIPGALLRAVGVLLFLVQNDESQILTGGEDRRAGAHGDLCIAVFQPLPLVRPLAGSQGAVEQRHLIAEMGRQNTQKLGRQGDLRHQEHGTLARFQAIFDQFQIDGGLSRAGDAVQQRHAGLFPVRLGPQSVKSSLLLVIEDQRSLQLCRDDLPAPQHRPGA